MDGPALAKHPDFERLCRLCSVVVVAQDFFECRPRQRQQVVEFGVAQLRAAEGARRAGFATGLANARTLAWKVRPRANPAAGTHYASALVAARKDVAQGILAVLDITRSERLAADRTLLRSGR